MQFLFSESRFAFKTLSILQLSIIH